MKERLTQRGERVSEPRQVAGVGPRYSVMEVR
jgi:hypothetical protein